MMLFHYDGGGAGDKWGTGCMKPKELSGNARWKYPVRRDRKGNLPVDTMIDGKRWQHQVHSQAAFARWSELMASRELIKLPNGECACDLSAGQGIEHDGRIWNQPQFA